GPSSDLRTAVVEQLADGRIEVTYADHDTMLQQVARGRTDAGLVVDEEAASAYASGEPVTLEIIPSSSSTSMASQQTVRVAIGNLGLRELQLAALEDAGMGSEETAGALEAATSQVPAPTVEVVDVDEISQEFQGLGQFDLGASSALLLFTFLTS